MEYFHIVVEQIILFIIYSIIGIIAVKTKVIDRKGLDVLARYITRIALPLLIFTNTINGSTKEDFLGALPLLGITVGFYLVLYLLAIPMARLFHLEGDRRNVYRACFMFGNIGFMAIPIVSALFPEHGMLYIALFTVMDQVILWTVGMNLTAPAAEMAHASFVERGKKMINPAMVGVLLAVALILLEVPIPALANTALTKVGATATPLAMFYLGGVFSYIRIQDYLVKKEVYGIIFLKMCIMPILVCMAVQALHVVNLEIAVTMGVICAMPGMTSIAMMAQTQKSDGDYCAGLLFVTTAFSIVTIPGVCLFLG